MRKLTAILFSDIVGFSKQMAENENKTLQILKANTRIHHQVIKQFGGTVVKAMGDGYLCTFNSSVDAVLAGAQIIRLVKALDQFELRIGIHVGDVVHNKGGMAKGRDVYGDGVNIAARIESNAPGQGVWVSERVAADLENHQFIDLKSAGMFELKNIPKPMEIYEIVIDENQQLGKDTADPGSNIAINQKQRLQRLGSVLIVTVIVISGWIVWLNWQDHNAPDSIAVLPLQFIGSDSNYDYLATSFTTDLSEGLASVKAFKVLSQATAVKLSKSSQFFSDLDVDYVIEGNVKKTDTLIRVYLSMVTADDDEVLWSETFEGIEQEFPSFIKTAIEQMEANIIQ